MKASAIVPTNPTDIVKLPAKAIEELRRTVDSAYDEVARSMKRAKCAATDAIDDGRYQIKRHPFTAVGSAALSGLALGFVIGRFAHASQKRK